MALIKNIQGKEPQIHQSVFLAENATVLGDVTIGANSSVWYQVVIRGDVHSISIGRAVNIQDGTIVHCTYKKASTYIGDSVSIGHAAIIHGCRIDENCLIGMGSILMDHVHVQSNVIVGAGSLVPPNKILESGHLYMGRPAKKIRQLTDSEKDQLIKGTADHYMMYATWHLDENEQSE